MNINTELSTYSLIHQLGILVNWELKDEFNYLLPPPLDEKKIISNLKKEPTDEEIRARFCSIRNITFNISDDCNFRCSYCSYSGNYEVGRTHNPNRMSSGTAEKMIELLIRWMTDKRRRIKTNSVNIGFYGGEALLELKLVTDIIEYARKRFREERLDDRFSLIFRLNTNGFLLNDDIVDILVKHNIAVDVSLDGPQEEHDKFRVTREGNKTWDVIRQNLTLIKERYPDYWQKVNFLVTLHPFHRFDKIDEYFYGNPDFFDMEKVTANFVSTDFLKEDLRKKFAEAKPQQRCKINLIKSCDRLDDKLKLKDLTAKTQFTGMCFPGESKLFVDTSGKLHVCERVKTDLSIGDVNNGIDYEAVRTICRQWNEQVIKNRCWECKAWAFCPICLSQGEDKEGIRIDCKYEDDIEKVLHEYLVFKEQEEEKKRKKEKATETGRPENIKEYLRQLE